MSLRFSHFSYLPILLLSILCNLHLSNKVNDELKLINQNLNPPYLKARNQTKSLRTLENKNVNFTVKEKAAVCAIALEEDAYVQEWVDYHLGLGFDFISIYDNSQLHDLEGWKMEQTNRIEVTHFPGPVKQNEAYRACAGELKRRGTHKWVAFFDVDEFLVLRQHSHVASFLNEFLPSGGLGVNWIYMGSDYRRIYEPFPVSLRFNRRVGNSTNMHIKSIAVINHINFRGKFHCHFPPINKKYKIIDTNGKRIRGPFNRNGPEDKASLYHFFTKSKKEFYQKRLRGRADTVKYDSEYYAALNASLSGWFPGDVFDNSVWVSLKKNVPHYNLYEVLLNETHKRKFE